MIPHRIDPFNQPPHRAVVWSWFLASAACWPCALFGLVGDPHGFKTCQVFKGFHQLYSLNWAVESETLFAERDGDANKKMTVLPHKIAV